MTDPIADMLNRIKNAQAVLQPQVSVPFSNLKQKIAEILGKEGFVGKIEKKGKQINKTLEITLKYQKEGSEKNGEIKPMISGLKRVSKPGQRIYTGAKNVKLSRGGYGIMIISTSKGLMTAKEARKEKLGGEIICEIW